MRRNNRKKISIPSKLILLVMSVICILFIFLSYAFDIDAGPVKVAAGYIFTPMQTGIGKVGNRIYERMEKYAGMSEVYDENIALKEEINELKKEVNDLKIAQYDVNELRSLLALDNTYAEYNKIAASIVGKDSGNWFDTFLINRGEKDGLSVGMNVIADKGLVGIITETGPNFAKVTSVIDDTTGVSAMVLSSANNCIVGGSLESMDSDGTIVFSGLNDTAGVVMVGDQLVTSYISSEYNPGILIGYITEIHTNSNNLTKSGHLKPAVDFEHLKYVYVITDMKETY